MSRMATSQRITKAILLSLDLFRQDISGSFMLLTLSITKVLFYKQHVIKIKNSYLCTVASLGLKTSYFDFISLRKSNILHLKINHTPRGISIRKTTYFLNLIIRYFRNLIYLMNQIFNFPEGKNPKTEVSLQNDCSTIFPNKSAYLDLKQSLMIAPSIQCIMCSTHQPCSIDIIKRCTFD